MKPAADLVFGRGLAGNSAEDEIGVLLPRLTHG
jgi:hypothetical protein